MPRVLLLVYTWARAGGLEGVTIDIANTFREFDWEVSVWAVHDSASRVVGGVASEPLAPENRFARSLFHRFLWRRALERRLASGANHFDLIVIGHAGLLPGCGPALQSTCTASTWLWAYGLEVWGKAARPLAPLLRRVDRIVSISDFTQRHLQRIVTEPSHSVVKCFVDTNRFVPSADASRVRRNEILICGRMAADERYKGHETLFRALPRAEELCGFPLRLSVIGEGSDRPRLEEVVRAMGIERMVEFRGRVSFEELIEAYQHCGVFAMPSRVEERAPGQWTGEGFGIVYIEAAACGRPVIASAHGGAPETLVDGETGIMVNPSSHEAVAAAVAAILRDPEVADEMGRRGRANVQRAFSMDRFRCDVRSLLQADGLWSNDPRR